MREWIKNNRELYDAMYNGGEGKNDHTYSARQVRLIVKYLDKPWSSWRQVRISYNETKISYNEIEISHNENKIAYREGVATYNIGYLEGKRPMIFLNIIVYTRADAREYSFI